MTRVFLFLSVCLLYLPLANVFAEGLCADCDRSLAPRLWIPDGDPAIDRLPLKSSQAEISIAGPIARITVTQRYSNVGKRALNARYVFPGSTRAAVHGLTMRIGERVIKARIKEKEVAAKLFEAAKQEGKRAALLDQKRPNVFMMDVANIQPGDHVELVLQYSELLVPEEGVYELVYPTVVGPRYAGDPIGAKQDSDWIANPFAKTQDKGGNPAHVATGLRVHLSSPLKIDELSSTQHQIVTTWKNDKEADIHLAAGETDAGNRDFILRFHMRDKRIASGLMTFNQDGENYFLMMAQPPRVVAGDDILPREYLFVIDVSGSMHGFPLDTARELMGDLLAGLRPGETFNILFFSGGSETLAPHPLPATPANIRHAMAMMRNYQGGGGTELLPALRHALDMPRTPSQARNIVVVTDGYVGVEREAYDLIRENLNSANLFAFGIGGSVNRYLIESLAHAGAGVPFVVTNPSEAADVAARFRRYISAPLLSDVALSGEGVELYDMEPATIPVMLGERPVVIFGKYRPGARPGRLLLQGRGAHGTYRASMSLAQADVTRDAELLPLLWARQRVKRLADMAGNDVVARRDEIVELGLKYSILTPFTSFIAVDEVVANPKGSAEDVQQALPLPHGVSELALGQPVPEPGDFWMIALLVIACTLAWRRKAAWSAGR